jgi:hypothetical protein
MILSEFLQLFCRNSLIRLLCKCEFEQGYYPANTGHDWDVVSMDHEIVKGKKQWTILKSSFVE